MPGHEIGHIHQILIVENGESPAELPPAIKENIVVLRAFYPNAIYRLWDSNSLREVISDNFEREVIDAFESLRPFAYKSDLARLCLLYVYGGLYVDLSMRFVNPIRPPDGIEFVAFKAARFNSPRWTAMSNGIIWAKAGRREMRLAVDFILENCRNRYYGANPLYPTGPVLFGHAVATASTEKSAAEALDDQWIGELRRVVPEDSSNRICYVAPDNSLIALSMKQQPGELSVLGVLGTNNYNEIWHQRLVYMEQKSEWTFDNSAIHRTNVDITQTGIKIPSGFHGIAIYGPYVDITPGLYRLTVSFSADSTATEVSIGVTARVGAEVIHEDKRTLVKKSGCLQFETVFCADHPLSAAEFTISVFGDFAGEFQKTELEKITSA